VQSSLRLLPELGSQSKGDRQSGGAKEIAAMMLDLQDRGCHNINFVSPSHVVAQILPLSRLPQAKVYTCPWCITQVVTTAPKP
jgi:uncharacterized Fe-S radical SAM superfamily protein PflX